MPRVSIRTLILMLELLVAVVALQYIAVVKSAKAEAVWLAGDCIGTANAEVGVGDSIVPISAPAEKIDDLLGP